MKTYEVKILGPTVFMKTYDSNGGNLRQSRFNIVEKRWMDSRVPSLTAEERQECVKIMTQTIHAMGAVEVA